MFKKISKSTAETQRIAYELATDYLKKSIGNNKARVIALMGDLGAGKTTFTQGFAKGLGIEDKIISPTFVLMRQHLLPNSEKVLFHIDLYRLEGKISPINLGIQELFDDPNSLVLIEWAEKMAEYLPENTLIIKFEKTNDDTRELIFS